MGAITAGDNDMEGFEKRQTYYLTRENFPRVRTMDPADACQAYTSYRSGDFIAGYVGFDVLQVEFMLLHDLNNSIAYGGDGTSPGPNSIILNDPVQAAEVVRFLIYGFPSTGPTFAPTTGPVSMPTGRPSSQPSGQPTAIPSSQPSGQPTAEPSYMPTSGAGVGGEDTNMASIQPTIQPTTSAAKYSFVASDHTWTLAECATTSDPYGPKSPSLCVDCEDPCSQDLVCDVEEEFSRYLAPCAYNHVYASCSYKSNGSSYDGFPKDQKLRMFSVVFKEPNPAPEIYNLSVKASTKSVQVDAALQYEGMLSCNAFAYLPAADAGSPPTERVLSHREEIMRGKYFTSTGRTNEKNVTVTLTIPNLLALTNYSVYCVTRSYKGVLMAFSKSIATKTNVKTTCCRVASINMATNVVYNDKTVNNLFTLTLESMAEVPPKFTLNTLYVPTRASVAYQQYYTTYTNLTAESMDEDSSLYVVKVGGINSSDLIFPGSLEPVRPSYTFGLSPASRIGRYMVNLKVSQPDRYKVYPYTWNNETRQYLLPENFNDTEQYYREEWNVNGTMDACWNHTVNHSSNCFWYQPLDYSHEYVVEYARSTTFVVVQSSTNIPAPKVTRAVYSDEGSYITLEFDSPTNRGGLSSLFSCDKIFDFPGVSSATCKWIDTMTIHAFVSGSDAAVPGDALKVIIDNGVTSLCDSSFTANCDLWSDMSVETLTIEKPESPVVPSVAINVPDVVTICDWLLKIDIAGASRGSAGREWKSLNISVSSTGDTARVQSWLNEQYQSVDDLRGRPKEMPTSLMDINTKYEYEIELCNFLGACGDASAAVVYIDAKVPAPVVLGLQERTMYRYMPLSLKGDVFYNCSGTNVRVKDLVTLSWDLRKDFSTSVYNIYSTSKDPFRFKLDEFVLKSYTYYTVEMTTTVISSNLSSSTSVNIFVNQSALVAVVEGGTTKTVNPGAKFSIDASNTYDPDVQVGYDRVTGKLTNTWPSYGFDFKWSCVQTLPTYNASCRLLMEDVEFYQSKKMVTAETHLAGTTHELTFVATDVTGGTPLLPDRSVTEVITITINDFEDLPFISLTASAGVSSSMNADEALVVSGTVDFGDQNYTTTRVAGLPDYCIWTLDDDGIVLSDVARSSSQFFLANAFTFNNLVIPKNTLPAGFDMSFFLTCSVGSSIIDAYRTSSATISVRINAPPQAGEFTITNPDSSADHAIALKTLLLFSAEDWTDDDDVIVYKFGYYPPGMSTLANLRSESETFYADLLLPAGRAQDDHFVTAGVTVSDPLGASATLDAKHKVKWEVVKETRPKVELASSVDGLLDSSDGGTVDEVWAAVGLSCGVMNTGECSGAPDCQELNRQACSSTDLKCGPCLETAKSSTVRYLGQPGDGNTECKMVSVDAKPADVNFENKSCANDCGGSAQGTCVYQGMEADKYYDTCYLTDTVCKAVCVCEDGFYGKDCSYSQEQMTAIRAARAKVTAKLAAIRESDDKSKSTVENLVAAMNSATTIEDELDSSTATSINNLAKGVLDDAVSLGLSYDAVSGVLDSVDRASYVMALGSTTDISANSGRRRRLLDSAQEAAQALATTPSTAPPASTHGARYDDYRRHLSVADDESRSEFENYTLQGHRRSSGGSSAAEYGDLVLDESAWSPHMGAAVATKSAVTSDPGTGNDLQNSAGTFYYQSSNTNDPERGKASASSTVNDGARHLGQSVEQRKAAVKAMIALLDLEENSPERIAEKEAAWTMLQSIILEYANLVASNIVSGERDVESTYTQFRLLTAALTPPLADSDSSEWKNLPATDSEVAMNATMPSMGFAKSANASAAAQSLVAKVTAFAIRSGLTGNQNFSSNPMQFLFSLLPCNPSSTNESEVCEVDLVLQNNDEVLWPEPNYEEYDETSYCYFDEFNTYDVTW